MKKLILSLVLLSCTPKQQQKVDSAVQVAETLGTGVCAFVARADADSIAQLLKLDANAVRLLQATCAAAETKARSIVECPNAAGTLP
jgi:hypothetical protein